MEFKNRLTLEESVQMIVEVVDGVFDVNDDTGIITYVPYFYDYALRLAIAKYYGGYTLSGDNNVDYELAMDIKIDDITSANIIDRHQFDGIKNAIDDMIEFKKNEILKTNINVVSSFDELVPLLTNAVTAITEKITSLDTKKLNKQLSGINIKNLVKEYTKSDRFAENTNEIIDAKNKEILELREKINILTDKKEVAAKEN